MKKVFLLLFVVVVLILFGGISAFAQTSPIFQDYLFNGVVVDGETTLHLLNQGQELQSVLGGCSFNFPYFLGEKRDILLNEDTTMIEVVYDPEIRSICAQVWGTWPGTQNNDGVSEFDSILKVYDKNFALIEINDGSMIHSNPSVSGVPYHRYVWEVPRGGDSHYVLLDFFQQQLLGNERLGMPHRDWSGVFRGEFWKIFLPIIFKPEPVVPTPTPTPIPPTPTPIPPTPTPVPTCPDWTIGATAPGFTVPPMAYKIGGNHYPNVGYLYFGETMAVRIKNSNGTVSDLPVGGETTVYNGVGQVVAEYGRDGSFEVVGGQGVFGEDFFTFDSSFPWQGITCRASFTIWDPELVLNALQENLQISRQEAIDLLDEYLLETNTNTLTQDDVWEWVKTH